MKSKGLASEGKMGGGWGGWGGRERATEAIYHERDAIGLAFSSAR